MERFDVLVIGAGIAGAAAGYELAAEARVAVLEREAWPGYHATGRSAASFTESYGHRVIRRLARASRDFLEAPPEGFAEHSLLTGRGSLVLSRTGEDQAFEEDLAEAQALAPEVHEVSIDRVVELVPVVRPECFARASFEPGCCDLDVAGLHQGFLKGLKQRGGQLICDAEVAALARSKGTWRVETKVGHFEAAVVINAAGAWADEIAALAGARPLGLVPKRRSAFTFDPPQDLAIASWPLISDLAESFYFKPDAGRILVSPADATPSPPCDAQPEELDIAIAVERIHEATTLPVRRIAHKWAGLRTFAYDDVPVVGFDPEVDGLFWLAGQGGYGVKTSPALGRFTAGLVLNGRPPEDLTGFGVRAEDLAPVRLRAAASESTTHTNLEELRP